MLERGKGSKKVRKRKSKIARERGGGYKRTEGSERNTELKKATKEKEMLRGKRSEVKKREGRKEQ